MFPSLGNEVGGDGDKEYQTYLNRIPPGLSNKIFIFSKNLHNWSLGSESETGINIPMVLDRRRESDNLCYLKLGNIILINHATNQVLRRQKKTGKKNK